MNRSLHVLTSSVFLWTLAAAALADVTPRQAIEAWAFPQGGAPQGLPEPQPIQAPVLAKLFPDYAFYSLVFPQWPVARMPPAPLKPTNAFAIDRQGKVQGLTGKEQVEAFFREHLPAVKDEATAKEAVRAWLALAEVLATDGWFKFTVPEDSLTAAKTTAGLKAAGKAVVSRDRGDRGQVAATLDFDAQGKLTSVQQKSDLKAGVRPICQSTKLLDPDPIVRKMAEQSLLIMGVDALPYLQQQRAKVGPELKQAIDRIYQEILDREAL